MNYTLCTISFRHLLVSLNNLLEFATHTGFSGIEIWGAHAKSFTDKEYRAFSQSPVKVTMLSHYIDLHTNDTESLDEKTDELLGFCKKLSTSNLRIFAGSISSKDCPVDDRKRVVNHLRYICDRVADHGLNLVIETHPGTIADNLSSTSHLIHEVNQRNFKVNMDVLHIWEAGDSYIDAHEQLKPYIVNYHFKNVDHRRQLHIFQPENVYSPSGDRNGMAPISTGVINYEQFLQKLITTNNQKPISLEWFGQTPFQQLAQDIAWLKETERTLTHEMLEVK